MGKGEGEGCGAGTDDWNNSTFGCLTSPGNCKEYIHDSETNSNHSIFKVYVVVVATPARLEVWPKSWTIVTSFGSS